MQTEVLIRMLAVDSSPKLRLNASFCLAMVAASLIAALIFFTSIGFRVDIEAAVETGRFLFKFAIVIPMAIIATAVMLRAARPGASFGFWGLALIVPPLLLAGGVLFELSVLPQSLWMVKLIGSNSANCMTLIPLLSAGPLSCFIFAMKHGAPTNPGLAGAVAGLAASGVAATFYAMNCFDDSPLFVVTWYPLAIGLVVLTGYACGLRFLKW